MAVDANTKKNEDRLWQQYLISYANMDEEHFTSFEDYKEQSTKTKKDTKEDVTEILKKAEKIRNMDQRKEVNK